ncbi:hypothetical protein GGR57DRAFT_447779 [Xylariaceae sp. FL1272]|nr:hypothetical protein GGR57DRAFT_447779 [Xylariaceae sp. FL1272]
MAGGLALECFFLAAGSSSETLVSTSINLLFEMLLTCAVLQKLVVRISNAIRGCSPNEQPSPLVSNSLCRILFNTA